MISTALLQNVLLALLCVTIVGVIGISALSMIRSRSSKASRAPRSLLAEFIAPDEGSWMSEVRGALVCIGFAEASTSAVLETCRTEGVCGEAFLLERIVLFCLERFPPVMLVGCTIIALMLASIACAPVPPGRERVGPLEAQFRRHIPLAVRFVVTFLACFSVVMPCILALVLTVGSR